MKKYLYVFLILGLSACKPSYYKKNYVTESTFGKINSIYINSSDDKKIYISFMSQDLKMTFGYGYESSTPISNFNLGDKVEYTITYCSNCFDNNHIAVIDMKKIQ